MIRIQKHTLDLHEGSRFGQMPYRTPPGTLRIPSRDVRRAVTKRVRQADVRLVAIGEDGVLRGPCDTHIRVVPGHSALVLAVEVSVDQVLELDVGLGVETVGTALGE